MNAYKHARTTVLSHVLIIERTRAIWTGQAIAGSSGISRRTVGWRDGGRRAPHASWLVANAEPSSCPHNHD